jgi:hypothetical protein
VCESKGDGKVQRREFDAHSNQRRERNPVAARRVRVAQPGGVLVRVFERGGVRRGWGLYGGVGVDEGARDRMDSVWLIRGDPPGRTPCLSQPPRRDDRWGHSVGERGGGGGSDTSPTYL